MEKETNDLKKALEIAGIEADICFDETCNTFVINTDDERCNVFDKGSILDAAKILVGIASFEVVVYPCEKSEKIMEDEKEEVSLGSILSNVENASSYSGRGMYGQKCVGITGNSVNSILESIMEAIFAEELEQEEERELVMQVLGWFQMDSMGKGIILYWEDVPFEGDE